MTPRLRPPLSVAAALCGWAALTGCTPAPAPPPQPAQAETPLVRPHVTAPYLLHATCPHVPDPLPGEAPPAPPGPPQALTPGHWEWVDGNYAWIPPQWHDRPSGPARAWQDGYWEANGGACVWHNGRYLPASLP